MCLPLEKKPRTPAPTCLWRNSVPGPGKPTPGPGEAVPVLSATLEASALQAANGPSCSRSVRRVALLLSKGTPSSISPPEARCTARLVRKREQPVLLFLQFANVGNHHLHLVRRQALGDPGMLGVFG